MPLFWRTCSCKFRSSSSTDCVAIGWEAAILGRELSWGRFPTILISWSIFPSRWITLLCKAVVCWGENWVGRDCSFRLRGYFSHCRHHGIYVDTLNEDEIFPSIVPGSHFRIRGIMSALLCLLVLEGNNFDPFPGPFLLLQFNDCLL